MTELAINTITFGHKYITSYNMYIITFYQFNFTFTHSICLTCYIPEHFTACSRHIYNTTLYNCHEPHLHTWLTLYAATFRFTLWLSFIPVYTRFFFIITFLLIYIRWPCMLYSFVGGSEYLTNLFILTFNVFKKFYFKYYYYFTYFIW